MTFFNSTASGELAVTSYEWKICNRVRWNMSECVCVRVGVREGVGVHVCVRLGIEELLDLPPVNC